MKILNRYNTIYPAVLLISLLLISTVTCLARNQNNADEQAPSFELNARIMEIDLANNRMVVAEEEIHLLSTMKGGEKIWQTHFVDAKKKSEIPAQRFKKRDRVRVLGNKTASGVIDAVTIALLAPATAEKQQQSQQEQNITSPSSTIHQEGGIWKN